MAESGLSEDDSDSSFDKMYTEIQTKLNQNPGGVFQNHSQPQSTSTSHPQLQRQTGVAPGLTSFQPEGSTSSQVSLGPGLEPSSPIGQVGTPHCISGPNWTPGLGPSWPSGPSGSAGPVPGPSPVTLGLNHPCQGQVSAPGSYLNTPSTGSYMSTPSPGAYLSTPSPGTYLPGFPNIQQGFPGTVEPISQQPCTPAVQIIVNTSPTPTPTLAPESEQVDRHTRADSINQVNPRPKNRRSKASVAVKFFYKNNLINIRPLPWFPTLELDHYFTELIIREISDFGQENRAKNELDFRTIFQNSRNDKSNKSMKVLIEGSPGYGKTTLARRIAVDWGRDAEYLNNFNLLIFITCRDLEGRNLDEYVAEFFPRVSHNTSESQIRLSDWMDVSEEILFILDGLDECRKEDSKVINKLLEGQTSYQKASILATSRPISFNDTDIKISKFSTKVEIKGFNRNHVEKLIDTFFENNEGKGKKLKEKLYGGLQAYENLVTCPLLCQLFCLLYEDDENLPDKATDVYMKLIRCLINREKSAQGKMFNPDENIPAVDEETLKMFGKLCIEALEQDKFYFKKEEILKILQYQINSEQHSISDVSKCDVIMGFLVKSNIPRKAQGGRGNLFGQQYYQPLHKTFLEFVAGFYLLCLVRDQDIDKLEEELELLSGMEYTSMEQLLLYSVEMLGSQAHFILGRLGCITHLKETTILGLLSASGFSDENVKALTSVLNLENITVNCSLKELDSWTYICTQSAIIQSLKVHWEPKMLSLSDPKVSMFFQELKKKNKSIQSVELSIFHGTMKEQTNVLFKDQKDHFIKELASFTNLLRSMMCKKNLKHLKVDLQVIQPDTCLQVDYSRPIINTVAEVFKIKGSDLTLSILILNVDLDTKLISTLLAGLEFYPRLNKLSLPRLSLDVKGFKRLAEYILQGNIKDLEVKLNLNRFSSAAENSQPMKTTFQRAQLSGQNLGVEAFLNTCEKGTPEEVKERLALCKELLPEKVKDLEELLSVVNYTGPGLEEDLGCFHHVKISDHICPLPICSGHKGQSSGFHILFSALKDVRCKLTKFHLDQCLILQQAEYFACLGDMLQENTSLKELKVKNLLPETQDIKVVFPLLLALRRNSHLTEVNLSSTKLDMDSQMLEICLESLSWNSTLENLLIPRWTFNLDLSESLIKSFRKFLKQTQLRKMNLFGGKFKIESADIGCDRDIYTMYSKLKTIKLQNSSLVILDLSHVEVVLNNNLCLKAREFIHMVQFTNLRELLISETWVPSHQAPVKDFSLCTFFDGVRLNLGKLENLHLSDWVLDISNPVDTINKLKRIFSSLPRLVSLVLDNYQVKVESTDSEKEYSETRPAPFFILKPCLKSLPNLARLSIRKVNVSREDVPMLVKALKYRALKNPVEVNVQFINSEIIEFISERLDSCKSIAYSYNKQTGILRIERSDDTTRSNLVQFSLRGGQRMLKMGGELVFSKSIRSTN